MLWQLSWYRIFKSRYYNSIEDQAPMDEMKYKGASTSNELQRLDYIKGTSSPNNGH